MEEVEQILQDIIFIDEGKIILYEDIEELKSKYSIFTVPTAELDTLQSHNPKLISRTLGHYSAILASDVMIENAVISKPALSDLFMEKVGGSHE